MQCFWDFPHCSSTSPRQIPNQVGHVTPLSKSKPTPLPDPDALPCACVLLSLVSRMLASHSFRHELSFSCHSMTWALKLIPMSFMLFCERQMCRVSAGECTPIQEASLNKLHHCNSPVLMHGLHIEWFPPVFSAFTSFVSVLYAILLLHAIAIITKWGLCLLMGVSGAFRKVKRIGALILSSPCSAPLLTFNFQVISTCILEEGFWILWLHSFFYTLGVYLGCKNHRCCTELWCLDHCYSCTSSLLVSHHTILLKGDRIWYLRTSCRLLTWLTWMCVAYFNLIIILCIPF